MRQAAPEGDVPRFLVIQYGARHGYAVPQAFNRLGALAGVYTDLLANQGLGSFLSRLAGNEGRVADALKRRLPPAEILSMFHTFDAPFIIGEAWKIASGTESGRQLSKSAAELAMALRGTRSATHLYTMLGEGGRFVEQAKQSGLGVVGDVYIALSAEKIVADEARRFPDWCDQKLPKHSNKCPIKQNSTLLTQSDLLICPSEFVRDDLIEHYGVDDTRTIIAPYAVNTKWLSLAVEPIPGRALFAGSANIRKGIHYLAIAAKMLRGVCEMRVAGGVSPRVRYHPAAQDLNFLGFLGPKAMASEFAKADVFVFPSLAEGSAGVTAEALGAGVPVVTTKAAGSIVRHGIDGVIVPERDPKAIADAVRSIVGDRDKRDAMSKAARQGAQQFTWDGFARRVIEATQLITEHSGQ